MQEGLSKLQQTIHSKFYPKSEAINLTEHASFTFTWVGNNHELTNTDLSNLRPISDTLRNDGNVVTSGYDGYTTYESGFIDLLNIRKIYIHSCNSGHYNSIGERGENTIIKKVTVSSSFGYQILDSVVAPHDKTDVSRKLTKTMELSFRNVHGNIIDLNGSHVSFSHNPCNRGLIN